MSSRTSLILLLAFLALAPGCTDEVPRYFGYEGGLDFHEGHLLGDFAGVDGVDESAVEGAVRTGAHEFRAEIWATPGGRYAGHQLELELWMGQLFLTPGRVCRLSGALFLDSDGGLSRDPGPDLFGDTCSGRLFAASGPSSFDRAQVVESPVSVDVFVTEGRLPGTVRMSWIARFVDDREANGTVLFDAPPGSR